MRNSVRRELCAQPAIKTLQLTAINVLRGSGRRARMARAGESDGSVPQLKAMDVITHWRNRASLG